ncbi:MAG: hypothetical protein HYZ14_12130 [Bacteroidetes bacterium]|nr:hypothetical protein [Bacteroidota bacterium]
MKIVLVSALTFLWAIHSYVQINYCNYFKLAVEINETDGKTNHSIWIERLEGKEDTLGLFIKQHQNRFDYILYNRIDFSKISDLLPDTVKMKEAFCENLNSPDNHSYFSALANENKEKIIFTQSEMLKIASRFFLCDKINETKLDIGYHICIGMNGQKELTSDRDYTLLEAFCFEAIFHYLGLKRKPGFQKNFESYISLSTKKHKKADLKPADLLEKVKQECYSYMENDADLKNDLLRFYEVNKENIGITIN